VNGGDRILIYWIMLQYKITLFNNNMEACAASEMGSRYRNTDKNCDRGTVPSGFLTALYFIIFSGASLNGATVPAISLSSDTASALSYRPLYFYFNYNLFILPIENHNPLNTHLNPICHLLALLGAHHILHVSRIRVNPYPANVENIMDTLVQYAQQHILVDKYSISNPLPALLGAHRILHVSRIRVKLGSRESDVVPCSSLTPRRDEVY
jgi:hypothetical protein